MKRLWSPLERPPESFEGAIVVSRPTARFGGKSRTAGEVDCGILFLGVMLNGYFPRKTCPGCVAHEVAVRV